MESGRPETTLLNTTVTLWVLRFAAHLAGLDEKEYRVIASGDDGFVALKNAHNAERLKKKYEELFMNDPESVE